MAKLKMLKLPKKPARSASLESKQKYLAKVAQVKKENQSRAAINEKSVKLDKVIAGISASSVIVRPSSFSARVVRNKKKASPAPKRKKARPAKPAVSGVKRKKTTATRRKPAAKRKPARRR